MWKLLKQAWLDNVSTRSGSAVAAKTGIIILGQKWLGPGETLRIVEVDLEGAPHRLALWNTKSAAQMIELQPGESNGSVARGASC